MQDRLWTFTHTVFSGLLVASIMAISVGLLGLYRNNIQHDTWIKQLQTDYENKNGLCSVEDCAMLAQRIAVLENNVTIIAEALKRSFDDYTAWREKTNTNAALIADIKHHLHSAREDYENSYRN